MDDVQPIVNIVVQIQRAILRMAEVQHNRVTSTDPFPQRQDEEARGIRGNKMRRQITVGRDFDISDRSLFPRIGILYQHGSPQREWVLAMPKQDHENRDQHDSKKRHVP